jgi:hypothetical protein
MDGYPMATQSSSTLIIDSGIKVLLLTALAYEAAFIYEVSYLVHFGIPIAFVDVSLHELLLCGIGSVIASSCIIWADIFWGAWSRKFPPLLAKSLMSLFLLIVGVSVLCMLLNAPLIFAAALIATFIFAAAALLVIPLIRHRRLPKIASRYWATFGDEPPNQIKAPSILWFSVSRGIIIAIATLVVAGVLSFAVGSWRARAQSDFVIHDLADNCAVLRLSGDGYLCVGIDFQKRIALGTFRFLDPKGLELHVLRVGPIASFESSLQSPTIRAAH